MRPRGMDPAQDLVDFLDETNRLDELLAETIPEAVIYEPVVRLGNVTIGPGSRIDSFVKLEGGDGLHIGRYVHIASFAHLGIGGGLTYVDDYSAIASGGKVISGSNQIDAITMSACAPKSLQHVERKVTRISKYAVVLTNATVLPGVTLHEGAVLAAGAVATRSIPEWEIWGGVPAKFLVKRVLR